MVQGRPKYVTAMAETDAPAGWRPDKASTGLIIDVETGEVIIPQHRLSGIRDIYASAVSAGDHIYFTSREGVTTVIKHGKAFEEVAVNDLGEPVDASPAFSGNQIFIRAAKHLYCISQD